VDVAVAVAVAVEVVVVVVVVDVGNRWRFKRLLKVALWVAEVEEVGKRAECERVNP
jgi:hypothetical protein